MIVLTGGDLILANRVVEQGSLVVDAGRISDVDPRAQIEPAAAQVLDVRGCYVVPGFIDVHVHGSEGVDTLDGPGAIAALAERLPRYGVTAFCPTTIACEPGRLRIVLDEVTHLRATRSPGAARVLPAHLESNFINPDYKGAQPASCLRHPADDERSPRDGEFSAAEILAEIDAARTSVGIVTLAPELPGGIDLTRRLTAAGHRVSLGHSGADFELSLAAIEAGACHATHVFNRMPPMSHRAPGLVGAALARAEIAAELICDGHHVHPAVGAMAIAAKGVGRVMAITDATAGAGLPVGATARLGGRPIHVHESGAVLGDGTLAGSTLTMNRAFQNLVTRFGRSVIDAAALCSTTAARELQLTGLGELRVGAIGDLVVLDRDFNVRHTLIDGRLVFSAP